MYCVLTKCSDGLYRRDSEVFKSKKDAIAFASYAIECMRRVSYCHIVKCDKSGNWSKVGKPVVELNPTNCAMVAVVVISSIVKPYRWS